MALEDSALSVWISMLSVNEFAIELDIRFLTEYEPAFSVWLDDETIDARFLAKWLETSSAMLVPIILETRFLNVVRTDDMSSVVLDEMTLAISLRVVKTLAAVVLLTPIESDLRALMECLWVVGVEEIAKALLTRLLLI
jgi:hypothetical protein